MEPACFQRLNYRIKIHGILSQTPLPAEGLQLPLTRSATANKELTKRSHDLQRMRAFVETVKERDGELQTYNLPTDLRPFAG